MFTVMTRGGHTLGQSFAFGESREGLDFTVLERERDERVVANHGGDTRGRALPPAYISIYSPALAMEECEEKWSEKMVEPFNAELCMAFVVLLLYLQLYDTSN